MTDLILIFPRTTYASGDPPLGVASIAAFVQQYRYSVRILDMTWGMKVKQVLREIQNEVPRVVGIYSSTLMLPTVLAIIKGVDGYKGRILVGGPHATVAGAGLLPSGVTVVCGEGEWATLCALEGLDYLRGDNYFRMTGEIPYPFPALDLLDMKRYMSRWHYLDSVGNNNGTNIVASRGCPFACSYCQPTLREIFGPKVIRRKPADIVAEMVHWKEVYGIKGFFFHDDTFTVSPKWLEEFLYELMQLPYRFRWGCNSRVDTVNLDMLRAMYNMGCRVIHYGIESGSQRILDDVYNKGIRIEQVHDAVKWTEMAKIASGGFFMLGAPTETREEIQTTISLALSLSLHEASFSLTVPLPGTRLYQDMLMSGTVLDGNCGRYDYYQTQPFESTVPLRELKRLQRSALIKFYWRRRAYLLRHFLSINGIRRLATKVRRFI